MNQYLHRTIVNVQAKFYLQKLFGLVPIFHDGKSSPIEPNASGAAVDG